MGTPNYREQRTAVYDGLRRREKNREGGRARADRRSPSQTSTATPRTRSGMRCFVGMEASAIHPEYIGIIILSNFLKPPMSHTALISNSLLILLPFQS